MCFRLSFTVSFIDYLIYVIAFKSNRLPDSPPVTNVNNLKRGINFGGRFHEERLQAMVLKTWLCENCSLRRTKHEWIRLVIKITEEGASYPETSLIV